MIPLIVPSVFSSTPTPTHRIPAQKGTDLEYLIKLADDAGHVFYIEPGPVPRTNIAYWGPQVKIGLPQPALNINMDNNNNVESLDFSFDAESKAQPATYIHDEESKLTIPVPLPDINIFDPPLGILQPVVVKITCSSDTANKNFTEAAERKRAEALRSAEVVTGNGSLDVVRYGHILKARSLVGVRGMGLAFDGLYYVKSVTHNIKAGEYKQNFTLTRNGLISTLPKLPV